MKLRILWILGENFNILPYPTLVYERIAMFKVNAGLILLTINHILQTCDNISTYKTRKRVIYGETKRNLNFAAFAYQSINLSSE